MEKIKFNIVKDGFYGAYYPLKNSKYAFIVLTSNTSHLITNLVTKWLHSLGINCLIMSSSKKENLYSSFPLERFEAVIKYLKNANNEKIGIIGLSAMATLALIASSYYEDLSLTIAISPSDFVMESFYINKGIKKLKNVSSSVSKNGIDLSYLPTIYSYSIYDQKLKEEAKLTKNKIASKDMFNRSESLNKINEDIRIKVENIKGTILFIGAEDDSFWNTTKYIKRMQLVLLNAMKKGANARFLTYKHGTHFLLPESLLKLTHLPTSLLPFIYFHEGKLFKQECKEARIDVDKNIKDAIKIWKEITLISDCKKKRISTFDEERFKDTILKRTKNL